MQRPDLATLACVNADCQHYGRLGQDNLAIRKILTFPFYSFA
jgi:hypothetical protein